MYLSKSILDGLKILGFDKETIKTVSREKSLEEIFLSTLFLNYVIVLVVFILVKLSEGITIMGRDLNPPVFFGLLMVYPFIYNVVIYGIYGLFGLFAELINPSKKVKPLLSVGFHTAIVYTILIYIIGLVTTYSVNLGMFLLSFFVIYFLLSMFLSLSIIYNYSHAQTLIVLFLPLLLISTLIFIGLYTNLFNLKELVQVFFL
ncbi:MAG: hypothetical protein PF569_06900 [Candidatus Woesearchaeota archaeon]|jgi:uncharacterized membrane protein|nr:hypothetical protein [Candidatus Woesearchaeota archaeon]